MQYPNNSNDQGGYYVPQPLPRRILHNYQEFVNSTEGKLSIQDKDSIFNLINQLPMLYAEGLQLAGETVIWLHRLTTGIHCPYWNEDDDQCSVSKCQICFNTSFIGGYSSARALKMSFTPGKSDVMIEAAGLTITQRPTAWTIITDPIMAEKDIIVTWSNERYEIHSAEAIEHQGRKHHQDLTLSRIDRNDGKYYIPVPGQNGEEFTDFACALVIRSPLGVNQSPNGAQLVPGDVANNRLNGIVQNMPGQNFPASIIIKNYYFNPANGTYKPPDWN